ncbi:hypothetical protein [uncultured Campylobacter sp.]|uniref:hypothetical protein n=1 Tax=uncultured Campylobacter sp. TaxID=218934 RepID=UPI0026084104|nr:hypothetical protein [uncultured Campylobacter sp.]
MSRKLQIKDINDTKNATTLLKNEKEIIDYQTGEIISREDVKVTKEKNREKFIKIFIDNLDYVIEALKPIEKGIFFVLMHEMNYHNVVTINSTIRKSTQIALNLSQPAVSKGINALIEKKVLIKIEADNAEEFNVSFYTGKEYLVNPQLIGSGSFKELSRIRRVITTTFDFDTLETIKKIESSYAYNGLDEVAQNLNRHEVKQVTSEVSPDGKKKETEILIGEKDHINVSDDVIEVKAVEEVKKSDIELEAEILRLKLANKEADNEKLRLQIKLASISGGKKVQPSLFDDEEIMPSKNDEDL